MDQINKELHRVIMEEIPFDPHLWVSIRLVGFFVATLYDLENEAG